MVDRNSNADTTEEHDDTESDGEEYEIERLVTREEAAAALRRLADGVTSGTVELGDGEITVTVPERFELEIEYEQASEEAELDVELEWPLVDGVAGVAEGGPEVGGDDDRARPKIADVDQQEGPDKASGSTAEADASRPVDEVIGAGDAASNARFELYRDRADEWRWRLVHDNGNIIADSGEGYDRIAAARSGLASVMRNAPGADVVETDD